MTNIPTTGARGRTLTAFFDTRGAADKAIADLEAAGIPRQHISRVDGAASSGAAAGTSSTGSTGNTGFLASLKDMFMPEEDRYGYAEGLGRGGFLVSVSADEANFTRVTDILDRDGAVDMDEREASWRKEGWTGYNSTATHTQSSTGAIGTGAVGTGAVGTGAVGTGAVATGAATAKAGGLLAAGERKIDDTTSARASSGDVESIPIIEERLNVGKRDVSHGRVRLRSYVVETPVEEQVSLHDETVQVDRRRVDRPVTAADEALFAEKTIELEEYAEEAVVSKEARVIEEIGLRKEASDRVETIHDTVRRTDVKVEDERGRMGSAVAGAAARFADQIRGDMEVVGSDGAHVGTVDHLDGGRIKLKKADAASGGEHHYLTHDLVQSVAGKVMLAVTAAEAKARWATA